MGLIPGKKRLAVKLSHEAHQVVIKQGCMRLIALDGRVYYVTRKATCDGELWEHEVQTEEQFLKENPDVLRDR